MTSPCPSALDLRSAAPRIQDHVATCPRCRALFEATPASAGHAADVDAGVGVARAVEAPAARRGTVWTLVAPDHDLYRFVAVLGGDEVEANIAVIGEDDDIDPINTDFGVAADRIGFSVWVRCATTFHVLREQLREQVGELKPADVEFVECGIQATADGHRDFDDPHFGPPILSDEDPRLSAFERWTEEVAAWREPWQLLATSNDLGAVCAARRVQLGISVEELAEQIDFPAPNWTRFESAALDLPAALPTATLAAAIRELALPVARKVLALAAQTVANTHRPDPGLGARALARRRQGVRRATPPPDPAVVQRAADQYAAALRRALEL